MSNQKTLWELSYNNKDNYVFYPHEEVIRFTSKYICKRIGINEFRMIDTRPEKPKFLDLGCGIGRHVIYASKMEFHAYGMDLSENAISVAKQWAAAEGISDPSEKFIQGDIRNMPWEDGFFDYVVSHGVLDSMHFEIAQAAVIETHRVLKPNGLFYFDVISGDDSLHAREFDGEEVVTTKHEEGTIQSYFNFEKIKRLIGTRFELVDLMLIQKENVLKGGYISRYHVVARRV